MRSARFASASRGAAALAVVLWALPAQAQDASFAEPQASTPDGLVMLAAGAVAADVGTAAEPTPVADFSMVMPMPPAEPAPVADTSVDMPVPAAEPTSVADFSVDMPMPVAEPTPVADASVDMPMPAADPTPVADAPMGMPMPASIVTPDPFTISAGVSAWRGDFGTNSTSDIIAAPVNARFRAGDFRFDATLPWMRIRSNGAIFTGIDAAPVIVAPGTTGVRTTREGLGDLTLGATALVVRQSQLGADLEVSGRVKLPTAGDSTGLSTGKVDYAVAAELFRTLGAVTPSVRLGYRFFGDPDGIDLRDSLTASAGLSFSVFERSLALVSYDFAQRASRFIDDSHEIAFGISTPLGGRVRLNTFGTAGLSDGAADFSAGLSLSVGFRGTGPRG